MVLTTPAAATAGLVERVDPASARALRRLAYNTLAVVHPRSTGELTGAGYQFSLDEAADWDTRGVTWNAGFLGRKDVYTCYLGGAARPEVVERSDDRLREAATREFEAVTGRPAEALSVRRLSPGMSAYDTSWTAIDGIDLPEGLRLCANYASRAGLPGRFREAKRVASELAERSGAGGRARRRDVEKPAK